MEQPRPDLDPLLAPDSIAILGASPDSAYSSELLRNLDRFGFSGGIYPVNPNRDEVLGHPCYPSLQEVPEVVDLAVVSIPRAAVSEAIREAGEVGVPAALVVTAGFSEAGEEGAAFEDDLRAVLDVYDIRVAGPQSLGLLNAHDGIVLTSTLAGQPEPGTASIVSQSGGFTFATIERGLDRALQWSYAVATGNEADLTVADFVTYLAGSDRVDAICVFIEGLDEPLEFLRAAEAAVRGGTPVFAVKVGSSPAAQTAAMSHTGSIIGSDAGWDALFAQSGAQRVSDLYGLLDRAAVHTAFDPPASNRVCVVSTSGGVASLVADMAADRGLELPSLREETEASLLAFDELLTFGELNNPVDIRGYGIPILPEIADVLFADDTYDAYVFVREMAAVGEEAEDVADHFEAIAERASDPVCFLWTGTRTSEQSPDADRPLPYERVQAAAPLFADAERCLDALASMTAFRDERDRLRSQPPRDALGDEPAGHGVELPEGGVLSWADAEPVLDAFDIPTVETRIAEDPDGAAEAAESLGWPVVLKVDSPGVPHRTDIGAVAVGLDSPESVRQAYARIVDRTRAHAPGATIEGVLVQPELAGGVEALVGLSRESGFGNVVTVAPGGTMVEAVGGGVFRVPPVSLAESRRAIDETALPTIVASDRQEGGGDLDALAELVRRVGELGRVHDSIVEMDLNPVVMSADGVAAVDVLIRTDG